MSKITFVTIGYIEWRKGQDVLVDAIAKLPKEYSEKVEFFLIGQDTSLMAQKLSSEISDFSYIRMIGTVSREEVHRILDKADMMICPSREDPMPTVCAEAMMHKVPCLVSDATGTATYIKDGYDGLIFKSENIEELRNQIIWCIHHYDKLSDMGERSYRIYEDNFSEKAFEHNLLFYVEEMIGKA